MSEVVALRPVAMRQWPPGIQWGLPCLATVRCPFCDDEHSHAVNAKTILDRFAWTCRSGRYRLALATEAVSA